MKLYHMNLRARDIRDRKTTWRTLGENENDRPDDPVLIVPFF